MNISSPTFAYGDLIPAKYTCDGQNTSPALSFSDIPDNAKSLVLVMEDPDIPKSYIPSGLFVHWIVYDMPADTKGIGEGQTPPGTPGQNGAGKAEYTGPCPPAGEHRYFFKLYALDAMLDQAIASRDDLLAAMEGHIVQETDLLGRYNRNK